jgi:hypothetical protein
MNMMKSMIYEVGSMMFGWRGDARPCVSTWTSTDNGDNHMHAPLRFSNPNHQLNQFIQFN